MRALANSPASAHLFIDRPAEEWRLRFNQNQTLILLIANDLVKARHKIPHAVALACQIAETLLFAPNAERVTLEFRANGAGFVFSGDDAPEAARAAGAARFRLSFDVAEYRAVVAKAFAERAEQMAVRDDA
jgi:hypothetical protein